MSREHSNPPFVLNVLRRIVDEWRKAGAEVISLADLEKAIDQMGEKQSGNRSRH